MNKIKREGIIKNLSRRNIIEFIRKLSDLEGAFFNKIRPSCKSDKIRVDNGRKPKIKANIEKFSSFAKNVSILE
jgi:hypothetical protein